MEAAGCVGAGRVGLGGCVIVAFGARVLIGALGPSARVIQLENVWVLLMSVWLSRVFLRAGRDDTGRSHLGCWFVNGVGKGIGRVSGVGDTPVSFSI